MYEEKLFLELLTMCMINMGILVYIVSKTFKVTAKMMHYFHLLNKEESKDIGQE